MATAGGVKGRGVAWLLGGIVIGVLGTVFLPGLADPYMPAGLRGAQQEVAGIVEAKSAEVDRLLLTIGSEAGAMLITYSRNVAEIDLLIDVGDSVVLVVDEYAPFIDDAKIRRVMKRGGVVDAGARESAPRPIAEPMAEPMAERIVEPVTEPVAEPTPEPDTGSEESSGLPVEGREEQSVEPVSSDSRP